ncbi:MAG: hypothetical protein E6K76_04685 [Candidatus Eisenbacteria bacterium]|uniref:DUF4412 domain-containing protein n=1 Tax=Eiseniibacteriota bacterium TaxID=2212470 RepID=A0A538T6X6_UNCEI|nr:MAG: hypothetical protein E6K76_04685 [Candidatus Eisenbacteria bacterium]
MALIPRRFCASGFSRIDLSAALFLALSCGIAHHAYADPKPRAEVAGAKGSKMVSLATIELPHYVPPPAFREDLVINNDGKSVTMKRFLDHGKIRTEIAAEGHQFIMIEVGDAKGTMYTLMPDEKRAMKQSRQAAEAASAKVKAKPEKLGEAEGNEAPPDVKAEDLGEEKLDGIVARKLRMAYGKEGDVLGWFDKATGAPLRMESLVEGEKATLEWKNRKVEPQPAELFAVPKGYEVTDMDEMMAKMGTMGAMGAVGGVGAMAKGMAGGMVQGMGSNLGGSLGSALGGSLGGPLGAMAGQFVGGKIGGMFGKKAANAIH